MKNTFSFLLFAFLIIQVSCGVSQEKIDETKFLLYEDNSITFFYPKTWKIKAIDTSQMKIKMYSIEEKLKESSFILSITLDNEESVSSMIEIQQNILNYYMPDSKVTEVAIIAMGDKEGLEFKYSFNRGLSYKGSYQSLKCSNTLISINYQYSLDEEERVTEYINEVIRSINCK